MRPGGRYSRARAAHGQRVHDDWLWTAQPEAYYAIFGYLGMVVLLLATRRRGAIALSILGGVLVGSQLLGKPTGILFVGCWHVHARQDQQPPSPGEQRPSGS